MGWFDEQIEDRKKQERRMLSDSFEKLEYAVTGRRSGLDFRPGADISAALETLLKYFGIREREIPPRIHDLEGQLDFLLTSSDIMYRRVSLEPGWHKDAMGAMIAVLRENGAVITVLRNSAGVYEYRDPVNGKRILLNAAEEKKIGTDAYCFYRPLPLKKITMKDLFQYMLDTISGWDLASFGLAALAITIVGMIMPRLNHILMDEVIKSGSYRLLAGVLSFMFFATVGNFLLTIIRQLLLVRIRIKLNVNVQAASMMRVLSLPATLRKVAVRRGHTRRDYVLQELSQWERQWAKQ